MALISDEVFSAYALNRRPTTAPSLTDLNCGLVAVLNGLSKFAGLPQMKAGWMILGGEEKLWRDAADRLELIADTFLSVSTPVQTALTELLRLGKGVQAEIRARTRANLEWLQKHRRPLEVEGGWYAVLPLPDSNAEDRFVVSLLAEDDVLVQPGFFFDFPSEGFVVLSLLTKPETFQEGVLRLVKRIER
jgi:aspartate/methionine/tyrosine aminotransferase